MPDATVVVEVWPLAADEAGLWLVSGLDAWRPPMPIQSDSDPHHEVQLAVAQFGGLALEDLVYIHSPSWRWTARGQGIYTYVVVVDCAGPVLERWPDAQPITLPLLDHVGKPPHHASTEAPRPEALDVLIHAVRHIRHEILNNSDANRDLNQWWHVHTDGLAPALAGLYQQDDATGQAA